MARCPECRHKWKTPEDEPPQECPACGFTYGFTCSECKLFFDDKNEAIEVEGSLMCYDCATEVVDENKD